MSTNETGDVAELHIAAELRKRGWIVSFPFGDANYDIVADDGEKLLRIQCKHGTIRNDKVIFRTETVRRSATGVVRRAYSGIDFFGVYCSVNGGVYLVPHAIAPKTEMGLRLIPTKNGQDAKVHYAHAFRI